MPQVGERKTVGGVTGEWDGQTWRQVQAGTDAPSNSGGFLSDLYHGVTEHPLDTLGGFMKGAATGLPTAARIAQVTLPFVTGGASIPVQMAIGAGSQGLADLADQVAGDPNAPQSFPGAVAHAATGAIVPGVFGAATKAYQALRPLATKGSVSGVGGAALGG
jgi:hypothetical protein